MHPESGYAGPLVTWAGGISRGYGSLQHFGLTAPARAAEARAGVCFACSVAFPALVPCDRHGRPPDAADGSRGLCGNCWEDAVQETRYGWEDPTDYGYGPEQWDDEYDEEQQKVLSLPTEG
ncbi:hypothetical protein [Streptomyces coeruleorubidus]|uniref:hypothetical protein n=1 Tax=Streptomyces coeruleorubidus TaxID=116188 RepID=UPI0037B89FA6